MESCGPPEELPEALREALKRDGAALAEELGLLGELPQVRLLPNGVFDRGKPLGSRAQLRGVLVSLRCCKGQLDQKCNEFEADDPRACPTHLEAARLLRAKVQAKHGSAECLAKARAALERDESEGSSSSVPAPAANAFAALLGRQVAVQKAQREVARAEESVSRLTRAEEMASRAREAATEDLEQVPLPAVPAIL
jgi:hypothetical protein